VNRATHDFSLRLGMTEPSMIGRTDSELFAFKLAQLYSAADRIVLETRQPIVNMEDTTDLPDGSQTFNLTTKFPLYDSRGNLVGVVGITRNVDNLRRAERAAQELGLERERVRLLQEFISSVSHDLRTPLTVIIACLYLLERYTDPQKQKEQVEKIKQQAWVLERFIDDILTSSRLENVNHIQRAPVQLNRLVTQLETQIYSAVLAKNLGLTIQLDPELPAVMGDNTKLYRVLLNLAQNAITYTYPGGAITIRTFAHHGQVIFEISDTGIGIDEVDMPRIFDHFYRADKARSADNAGTGLGLAIAERIVHMHGGQIQAESALGKGSTFRVLIPAFTEHQ
jgi:signal transduction histidine kinase